MIETKLTGLGFQSLKDGFTAWKKGLLNCGGKTEEFMLEILNQPADLYRKAQIINDILNWNPTINVLL